MNEMTRTNDKRSRGPRFSAVEDRLLEDGRPLKIPSRIVGLCLAAGGYEPGTYVPVVSRRVAQHMLRISTFIGAALLARERSTTQKGGSYAGE